MKRGSTTKPERPAMNPDDIKDAGENSPFPSYFGQTKKESQAASFP
jgi:hypothetical protein